VTTEAMRVHLFCLVDDRLGAQHKEPLARLSPSAVVTIGVLFALKGGFFPGVRALSEQMPGRVAIIPVVGVLSMKGVFGLIAVSLLTSACSAFEPQAPPTPSLPLVTGLQGTQPASAQ
jgi:hypothetical protein